jgi:cytochrome d ubiquinol oxidase subunit I
MTGCGLVMLVVSWWGSFQIFRHRLTNRWFLRLIFVSFPLPFIATLTGWFTAEVGRQPWTIYGVLRTADAVTPHLAADAALSSLAFFTVLYATIFGFGALFIYRRLRAGPAQPGSVHPANPKRPLALGTVAAATGETAR